MRSLSWRRLSFALWTLRGYVNHISFSDAPFANFGFSRQHYQQTLDLTVGEDERIFFKVDGSHTIHLTGNYVMPTDEHDHDHDDYDEEDYDLSPDEDELELEDGDESDDLDGLDDPRVMEIDSDEEEAPKLVKSGKGKKRSAEEVDDLDALISKDTKAEAATNGDAKLSKKQQKKLKKNNGEAAEAPKTADAKKVQFAKNLEQGPTGSTATKDTKAAAAPKAAAATTKVVQGIKIEDKKAGSGTSAKKGDKLQMRYIGKLENGQVFDCKTP